MGGFLPSGYLCHPAGAGTGGTISPSGEMTVSQGTSKTFTITPNAGYRVSIVYVDGVSIGAVTSYTFSNVNADHGIWVEFHRSGYLCHHSRCRGRWFDFAVRHGCCVTGTSKTFTITPNAGYRVSIVYVDGSSSVPSPRTPSVMSLQIILYGQVSSQRGTMSSPQVPGPVVRFHRQHGDSFTGYEQDLYHHAELRL